MSRNGSERKKVTRILKNFGREEKTKKYIDWAKRDLRRAMTKLAWGATYRKKKKEEKMCGM